MRGRMIFLVEEPSMKKLLDGLLPRLFPKWEEGQHFLTVPHEGKRDLDASITRKLKAWRHPHDRFIIVRDNDGADCKRVKAQLLRRCDAARRSSTLVRLICQELESWYLGDLDALARAYSAANVNTAALRKRFVTPDFVTKPSVEVKRLVPAFQKGEGARALSQTLSIEESSNRSVSYGTFITGVRRMAGEMGQTA